MWSSTETFGGAVGGGFMNNTFSSPSAAAGKGERTARRAANLVPVTIRQLHDSPDENLKIEDSEVQTLTVVGIVRRVEITTTRVSYVIDDHTGSIEALIYVGPEDNSEIQTILSEGMYARVVGSLRSQRGDGQKYILIFKSFQVMDMNEITCHNLEVIHVPLKLKSLKEMEEKKSGFGSGGYGANTFNSTAGFGANTFSNTMVGGGMVGSGGNAGNNMSSSQEQGLSGSKKLDARILAYLRAAQGGDGVHKDQVAANLGISPQQAGTALEALSSEGHIYSTKDDDHYMVTET